MSIKIGLLGPTGVGKSSTGNALLGKEFFKAQGGVNAVTRDPLSGSDGKITVYDNPGTMDTYGEESRIITDTLEKFKTAKINMIGMVWNITNQRGDTKLKEFVELVCEMFVGKYIWKHIAIIFTYFPFDKEDRDEYKKNEKDFIKVIIDIAKDKYRRIIENQPDDYRVQDINERLVDNIKCFYISKKRKDGKYDPDTIKELNKIKKFAATLSPIDKVTSRILKNIEIKDNLYDSYDEDVEIKDKGFFGVAKRFVGHVAMPFCKVGALIDGIGASLIGKAINKEKEIQDFTDDMEEVIVNGHHMVHSNIGRKMIKRKHETWYRLEIYHYHNGETKQKKIVTRTNCYDYTKED